MWQIYCSKLKPNRTIFKLNLIVFLSSFGLLIYPIPFSDYVSIQNKNLDILFKQSI